MPSFELEKAAGGRVAGVDEVGRGPLAGPVLAAAVVFTKRVPRKLARLIDDSKKLTAEQRVLAFQALLACAQAQIAVGAASVEEIGRLNILHAALLAMRRAVERLPAVPDLALIDGNRPPALPCPTQCVVGGDAISLSIAAASIVAKVLRDRGHGTARRAVSRLWLGSQRRLRHRIPPCRPPALGTDAASPARFRHGAGDGRATHVGRHAGNRLTRRRPARHDARLSGPDPSALEPAGETWRSRASCRSTRCCWATASS